MNAYKHENVALSHPIKELIKRHPYFSASLLVHALILGGLWKLGTYQIEQQAYAAEQGHIEESRERAIEAAAQTTSARIEKIKQLMAEALGQQNASKNGQASSTSSAGTPEQAMEKAKRDMAAIEKMQQQLKAKTLSETLHIPPEEAMKKVQVSSASAMTANAGASSSAPSVAELRKMEAQATNALKNVQQQLAASHEGVKVHSDSQNSSEGNGSGSTQGIGAGNTNQGASNRQGGSNVAADFYEKKIGNFISEYAYGGNGFFGTLPMDIPNTRSAAVKQSGISLGNGGTYTERFYINSWYVIGPFKGNNGDALFHNPHYPPEDAVNLDAVYIGKNDRLLRWNYVISNEYPFIPPDGAEDAVYYGYTELRVDKARDVWMWFGSDDDMQVWLNDKLVWAGEYESKMSYFNKIFSNDAYRQQWNLSEAKQWVHLQAGSNKLLFKLSNGPNPNGVFASIIITR